MGSFGDQVRKLRQEKGVSVREFARRLDKSPGYISQIEVRDEIPSPELICLIAQQLDAAPEKLLEAAKSDRVEQVEREIKGRHEEALSLFRRKKK